ncbi:MAG: 30S ribosomal protein S2 [Candidatus Omnitrophica bacterium]|nr:30S ribosomal protein S2 [Candidatus Omnitrophota bacterium]
MDTELIKQLLEAGAHFGHNRSRCNPKMKRFVFGERSKIYIIDLEKTVEFMTKAREFLKEVASRGEKILFVGTKKQAQDIIVNVARNSGMFFVKERWLGGTLTNFKTIRNSIKRLKDIETMQEDGTFEAIKKKERAILVKEMNKLRKNLQGIVDMKKMPGAVFVVDAKKEEIAVKEAHKLGIPIVAIVDTNADPDLIDYPIPANDDAMRSIKLIIDFLSESITDGKKQFDQTEIDRKAQEAEEEVEEVKELSEKSEKLVEGLKVDTKKEKDEKRIKPARKKDINSTQKFRKAR